LVFTGKLNDYEIYDNYSVGSNVIVLTYLTRHDLQPLRWRFIFYRPDKQWGLINMASMMSCSICSIKSVVAVDRGRRSEGLPATCCMN